MLFICHKKRLDCVNSDHLVQINGTLSCKLIKIYVQVNLRNATLLGAALVPDLRRLPPYNNKLSIT